MEIYKNDNMPTKLEKNERLSDNLKLNKINCIFQTH